KTRPPTACPQALQDHVAAHDQAVALVVKEALRLELRQNPFGDRALGQGIRSCRILTVTYLVADLLKLPDTQDARAPDRAKEVWGHRLRHFGRPEIPMLACPTVSRTEER